MTPDGDGPFGFGILPDIGGGDNPDDVDTDVLFNLRADLTEAERARDALEEAEFRLEQAAKEVPRDVRFGDATIQVPGFDSDDVKQDLNNGASAVSNLLVDVQTLNQRIQGLVEDVEQDLHGERDGVL